MIGRPIGGHAGAGVGLSWRVVTGDAIAGLASVPAASARCCVTSPPYWGGLRDYGHAGQLGMERDPAAYVAGMVAVFDAVGRCLTADGTLWLNVGDVYAASGMGGGGRLGGRPCWESVRERKGFRMPPAGYKMKDLTLVPFLLAAALRSCGWFLRSTIVWRKARAVEPVRLDRPSVSHEYVFLLSKSLRSCARNPGEKWWGHSVWAISSESVRGFPAAMPVELARRCIVAGSAPGDTVIDPFTGSGTTGVVSIRYQRSFVGTELNKDFAARARARIGAVAPLLANEDRGGESDRVDGAGHPKTDPQPVVVCPR